MVSVITTFPNTIEAKSMAKAIPELRITFPWQFGKMRGIIFINKKQVIV